MEGGDIKSETISGEKVDYTVEQVYNVETGESYIKVVEAHTTLKVEGGQIGVDIPNRSRCGIGSKSSAYPW